jgi:hypothetical protein
VGQGGYYRRVGEACAVLLAAAGAVLISRQRFAGLGQARWLLVGLGVMIACATVTGVADGHPVGSAGPVVLLAGLAVILAVVAAASEEARLQLVGVVLGLGVFMAATGWVGVAFHLQPLAHPDGGLWRAATTVTYANAAAAVLAPLGLLALARTSAGRGRLAGRAGSVVLLVGLGATLSRAGIASFAVGLAVLAALLGLAQM